MERKYITCDPELCTGCGICEMVCSAEKEGIFQPELSRIHLALVNEKTAMSIACRFCEDTPCIEACPREALTMDEAIGIYTQGSAYLSFDEKHNGTIELGKRADFTVMAADPRDIEPQEVPDIPFTMTVVDGEIVWSE